MRSSQAEESLKGSPGLPSAIVPKDELVKVDLKLGTAYPVVSADQPEQTTASRTQSWINAWSGLLGVREAAKRDKRLQFTALLHHVSVPLLLDSFYGLKWDAAPGVDGVTWKEYETDLHNRLKDLHSRVHRGTPSAGVVFRI